MVKDLGPVVQSIVRLTSSLRDEFVKRLRPNALIFFLKTSREPFSNFIDEEYWPI